MISRWFEKEKGWVQLLLIFPSDVSNYHYFFYITIIILKGHTDRYWT